MHGSRLRGGRTTGPLQSEGRPGTAVRKEMLVKVCPATAVAGPRSQARGAPDRLIVWDRPACAIHMPASRMLTCEDTHLCREGDVPWPARGYCRGRVTREPPGVPQRTASHVGRP